MSGTALHARSRRVWLSTLGVVALGLGTVAPASALSNAGADAQSPVLTLSHLIHTRPFKGSRVKMNDNEDSVYVPRDRSLWLVDDDARRVYEINPFTGRLKRTFYRRTFQRLHRHGGGPVAGVNRDRDFESLAYDASHDTLYVFSGVGGPTVHFPPTVFRFRRVHGHLKPVDYQPLPAGSDFSAAAWNPADHKIYVGVRHDIRSYSYASNLAGSTFQIPRLGAIEGFDFSGDGKSLYVARSQIGGKTPFQLLTRVDWADRELVSGWNFDLARFGMRDVRGVTQIGDRFYVSDGYDFRPAGDPKDHAVFVFHLGAAASAPRASFRASRTSGAAPLRVRFTNTSTGSATRWVWHFGDGSRSYRRDPVHRFARPGDYTVTLVARNARGRDRVSTVIRARDLRAPRGRFVVSPRHAHVRHTRVAITQRALHDNFTPRHAIRRIVRWGDGTAPRAWRTGLTRTVHVYRKRGIYHPRVVLIDRAGNHRVVHTHRVVVRR